MSRTALVEMTNIHKRFGGVHAVNGVSIDLYPGEVVGILGHHGAGKTVLMKALSGAIPCDEGEIRINGEKVGIASPRDARKYGIETIYQTLALADNLDAPGNLFLGREIMTQYGTLNDRAMENEAQKVIARLNPNFTNITDAVKTSMVAELIKQLKSEGIGIFLISHDLHDVFDLSDRVSVIKNGKLIGTRATRDVTKDEVLGMIIMGKLPAASPHEVV